MRVFIFYFLSVFIFPYSIFAADDASLIPIPKPVPMPITVLTELDPPFQVEDAEKNVKGSVTRLIRALFERSQLPVNITAKPWVRSYADILAEKNTGLYSVIRTAEREPHFVWIGPLIVTQQGVYRLRERSDIEVHSIEDLKNYNLGVLNNDARHLYFRKKGFLDYPKGMLQPVNNSALNYSKLFSGRVDLIVMSELVCSAQQLDCERVQLAMPLKDLSQGVYLVFRRDSDKDLIDKLNHSFSAMEKDGTLKVLRNKIIHPETPSVIMPSTD